MNVLGISCFYHDAAACLHVQHAVFDDSRAQRNRDIHVAVKSELSHSPCVDAALHGLELVDDFHRTHFRRT